MSRVGRALRGVAVVTVVLSSATVVAAGPLHGMDHLVRSDRVVSASAGAAPGYRLASASGGVYSFGAAAFAGSLGGHQLNQPIVGMAATASDQGYWLVASDGGIFSFGDAGFFGSTGAIRLNQPIVGMAATVSGRGYWLVAADGGVFSFGDAPFFGSAAGAALPGLVTSIARTPAGDGYWIASTGGGVATYGAAGFFGSASPSSTSAAIAGLVPTQSGAGYWLVDFGGAVFAYGDAPFLGSLGGGRLEDPMVGMATPWAAASGGGALRLLGTATALGIPPAVRPTGNSVALTFDDGPNPAWTPQVLDVLDRYGVKAVFFVVGQEAVRYPQLVHEIAARGNVVANHTFTHPELPKLSDAAIASELSVTSAAIQTVTGKRPRCMRPPYGATNARVLADVHRLDLQQILWDVDPKDYTKPGASAIASRIVSGARPGAILPLHDGGGDRSQTVAALPAIIEGVRAKGLSFVPICG